MTGKARRPRTEVTKDRDAQAARLRALRLTYAQIAEQLGFANESGAYKAAQRGRVASVREPHQDMVLMDLAELDEMAREAWKVLRSTHYVVSQGRLIYVDDDSPPLADDAPVLAAIGKLLDIQVRRAKLVGLDQPVKATVTHATTDIDAAVSELAEVMRAAAETQR